MSRIFKLKLTDPKTNQPWTVIMEHAKESEKTKYSLDEPLVKFYDMRNPSFSVDVDGDNIGQFVSSYYVSSVINGFAGIVLHGGEPSWQVSTEFMAMVRSLIAGYFSYAK